MILSIVIPAYNAEPYLRRCFDSVYNNAPSMDMFEVVVVNDGSKDNTLSVLNDYANKYPNMTVIDQPNGGVSVARNKGIDAAKGDYVLFLDVDDELVDGALEKVCVYLSEREPMDMLVTRQIRKNSAREWLLGEAPLEEHQRYNGVEAYKRGYVRTNAGGGICRIAFLREHQLRFPEGVKNAEDTIFFGHLQVYAQAIVYFNLPLYRIMMMDNSASRNCDFTKLAQSHIITMHSVAVVKKTLECSKEQRGIFDYVVYQLLSNTIGKFVRSKDLTYHQFRNEIDVRDLLPLDIDNMYLMKRNARMINTSLPLFYFFVWMRHQKIFRGIMKQDT